MSDGVRVTALVAVDPATAFHIFTQETALWWRREPRFGLSGDASGVLAFDCGPAMRVVEQFEDGRVVDVGRILVWEPGARVAFEWTSGRFAPAATSEVDVRFTARRHLTEVSVEHRGLQRPGEPRAFHDWLSLWWGDLVTAYRQRLGSAGAGADGRAGPR